MCLKSCCGIFTAKTGTLILLWITVLCWSIGLISVMYEISIERFMSSGQTSTFKPAGLNSSSTITVRGSGTGPSFTISSVALCSVSFILAIAVSGLFAIEKRKPTLLIPYFVYRIFCTFITCLLLVPMVLTEGFLTVEVGKIPGLLDNFGEFVKDYVSMAQQAMAIVIMFQIAIMVIEIHFTSIIYYCYRQMEKAEELERRAIPMNATWSAADKTNVHLS